ncbi:hypothetical protein CPB85DRAFT_1248117 [Mucidula mucida]|nr:hypothetical protein CPB85DRAFT_1248117 [Mucidula mucida]
MLKQKLSSFSTNDSANAGRSKKSHPRPSSARLGADSPANVPVAPAEESRDRKPHINGVQTAYSLTPGPTKQPYYPAIRFVEQNNDVAMTPDQSSMMTARTNPHPPAPTKRPGSVAIKPAPAPEPSSATRTQAKTRIDTSATARPSQDVWSPRTAPQFSTDCGSQRPMNLIPSNQLNYQYDSLLLRPQSSASASSPSVPERRHTTDTPSSRPPLPPAPRRYSDQTVPPQTPSSVMSSSPQMAHDLPPPFPLVHSRPDSLTPPHIKQAASQAIAPVQALFEQAWTTNVQMVHQQLTRIYQESDARYRADMAAADANSERFRRERDEARQVANKLHAELDELKTHARNMEAELVRIRHKQHQKSTPAPVLKREEPPTPNSAHIEVDHPRQSAMNDPQAHRTIRLSPPSDAYSHPRQSPYSQPLASPHIHPTTSSPFARPASSFSHVTNSPPTSHRPRTMDQRYQVDGERSPVVARQDSTSSSSSRRMDYSPSSSNMGAPQHSHLTHNGKPVGQMPTPIPRSVSESDRPMGRLSPSTSTPPQPRLQPQAQHSLPRFATLDLPALKTSPAPQSSSSDPHMNHGNTMRSFKRTRAEYESEDRDEGVSSLPSSAKVTKTSHQDTPKSRGQSVNDRVQLNDRPPSRPTSAPLVKSEPTEEGEMSAGADAAGGDSDKEQRPPDKPPSAPPSLPSRTAIEPPTPVPAPMLTLVRVQPQAGSPPQPREREPFRTSSASNSNPPAVPKPDPPPPKKGLGIKHLDLLYEQRNQEYICRMCLNQVPRPTPTRFPLSTPWAELVKHCEEQHPDDCQEMERLGTGSLAEMSVRRKMGVNVTSKR